MAIIRLILSVLLLFGIWLLFLIVPPWLCCIDGCRRAAVWNEGDRIKKYREIRSPWLAKMLIPRYRGYSTHITTNIPLLYNQFEINQYPNRMSMLGLFDYCISALIVGFYAVCITDFFFFHSFGHKLLPVPVLLMIAHGFFAGGLADWNRKVQRQELISRKEMRLRKRHQKAE